MPPLTLTSDLGSLLTIALGVISLSTLAGYGLLRGRVADLRDQLRDERDARSSLKGLFDDQHTELVECQSKVKVLESVVTGEVHWVALGDKLDHHHEEAKEHWQVDSAQALAMSQLLTEIRDSLRNH